MANKILSYPELRPRGVLVGRRQIDRLEAAGKFPTRVQISPGRVGWLADEIDDYVKAAIAQRPPRARNDQPQAEC